MINYLRKVSIVDIFIILIIFFLDRISKILVISYSKKNLSADLFSSKFLNISLIWNEGIAFGLFSFEESSLYDFLTIFIFIVIIVIFFMILKNNGMKKFSLLMILGGAIGNVYDRIFFKAVPDFIDFHIGNFHWFIFNVSDIFISLGVLFLIYLELIDNQKGEVNEKN